eukprot:6181982-Pleurochrysis_carterae.AAC.1
MSRSQQRCFQTTMARSRHTHKSLINHLGGTFFKNIANHWEMSPETCPSGNFDSQMRGAGDHSQEFEAALYSLDWRADSRI